MHNDLGSLVREYRLLRCLTQLDMSKLLGYDSTQFVSLFERGMSKVPVETLGKLIVILEIPEAKVIKILIAGFKEKMDDEIGAGKLKAQKVS